VLAHLPATGRPDDKFTSDIDRAAAGFSPDRVYALVWAFSELLVEPMKSEGIFELYGPLLHLTFVNA